MLLLYHICPWKHPHEALLVELEVESYFSVGIHAHVYTFLFIFLYVRAIIFTKTKYHVVPFILYLKFDFYIIAFGAMGCEIFGFEVGKNILCSSRFLDLLHGKCTCGTAWTAGSRVQLHITTVHLCFCLLWFNEMWPIHMMWHIFMYILLIIWMSRPTLLGPVGPMLAPHSLFAPPQSPLHHFIFISCFLILIFILFCFALII